MSAVGDLELRDKTPTPARRGRVRWVVSLSALLLVAALVVAALVYDHWRHSAKAFYGYGNSDFGPMTVGQVMYANAGVQPTSPASGHRFVDLRRITPRIATNTAGAHVALLTCDVSDADLGVGLESDLDPCAEVLPFRPGKIDVGFPATEIIYKITATRPGTLEIDGADVQFADGGRDGTQHVGMQEVLHVKAARG